MRFTPSSEPSCFVFFLFVYLYQSIFKMMASVLRFSALAAVVSAVSGYALGEMPSQTIGIGMAITDIIPTNAPSLELVKRSLKKKAVTNTCSEWTISEGLGW